MVARTLDFPLGRPIVPAAQIRRRRDLPPDARALVRIGERVRADQPIAEESGRAGTLSLLAGMPGTVADVGEGYLTLEGGATILQGLLGIGATVAGALTPVSISESPAMVSIPPGAILVYPQRLPLTLLQRAVAGGAAGIIAGSAAALELEAFARTDLSALLDELTSDQGRPPLTVLLTEGLGEQPMPPAIQALLNSRAGSVALLTGTTHPRRNQRPEVLLAMPPSASAAALPADASLAIGARVRITAGRFRGAEGTITHIFAYPQPSETGQLLPSVQIQLEHGGSPLIPVALLDRLA